MGIDYRELNWGDENTVLIVLCLPYTFVTTYRSVNLKDYILLLCKLYLTKPNFKKEKQALVTPASCDLQGEV